MGLLLTVIGFSIWLGYRAERMDRRRFLILLGFITIAVLVQLTVFYIAPPEKLEIRYEDRTSKTLEEGPK